MFELGKATFDQPRNEFNAGASALYHGTLSFARVARGSNLKSVMAEAVRVSLALAF